MGVIQIYDIFKILRKYFTRIVAACLAVGILAYFAVSMNQSYTCTLNFKYNYASALEGFAPDGVSEMDPYELENPAVVQAAINYLGADENLRVEGIRSDMSISTIITSLDQEVTESAAVMGEKYEVQPVEYQLSYSYDAALGTNFGPRMFDGIIKAYDEFVISKYYNKEHIADFMKELDDIEVDYLESSDIILGRINDIIEYLDSMANGHPDFRSTRTGYTFADLSSLYQQLRDQQHAKYHGNIRAGHLALDNELTVKNYTAKVHDLMIDHEIYDGVAANYQNQIETFYDSYKAAGLYKQASTVQVSTNSSNNRDQGVFRDYEHDFDQLVNTYDRIVTSYTDNASEAARTEWDIDNYNRIISDFANDTVSASTKERLVAVNDVILSDLAILSNVYSKLANEAIDEFFSDKVSNDIKYLISTDISADKSPMMIAVLAMFLVGGMLVIALILFELIKQFNVAQESSAPISLDSLDHEHRIAYEQYQQGFSEFAMHYQPMLDTKTGNVTHFEAFLRWENKELGSVSPMLILEYYSKLKLIKQLNAWIFDAVCKDIPKISRALNGALPVIHVNCLYSEIENLGLHEMLIDTIKRHRVNPSSLCIELDGDGIVSCFEDVLLLKDMGLPICIDHFEAKAHENEILQIIEPEYVKMSSDAFSQYHMATTEKDMYFASMNTITYFSEIINKCSKKHISVCICGIENKMQNELISRINFSYKQGYLFGHPAELNECLEMLQAKN